MFKLLLLAAALAIAAAQPGELLAAPAGYHAPLAAAYVAPALANPYAAPALANPYAAPALAYSAPYGYPAAAYAAPIPYAKYY